MKKSKVIINDNQKERLAFMMKRRAEIILESRIYSTVNLFQKGSLYFSSYTSKGKSIDIIFNNHGILLSYKLNNNSKSDFYCLSETMKGD